MEIEQNLEQLIAKCMTEVLEEFDKKHQNTPINGPSSDDMYLHSRIDTIENGYLVVVNEKMWFKETLDEAKAVRVGAILDLLGVQK